MQIIKLSPAKVFISLIILTASLSAQSDDASEKSASSKPLYIKKVNVSNTVNANPGLIINNSALKQGEQFSPKDVHETIKALYALGLFSDISVEASDIVNDSLEITINVTENPIIHKIEFSGNNKIDKKELEDKSALVPGSWMTAAALNAAKNSILTFYKEKGYLLAEVEANTFASKEDGRTVVEFTIKEGKKVAIGSIVFEGATTITEKKLKAVMQDTKEDRWWRSGDFDENKFSKDLELIQTFYQSEGFLDARINSHEITYSDDKRKLNIKISVTENSRYYFGKVLFAGNELFNDTILTNTFGMKPGSILNKQQFDLSKYNIESLYREEGYLYVNLQEEKAYRGDTIDFTFRIKEGLPAYVNKIIITGNTKTWDKVIRREVLLRPGEIYRQSHLFVSQRNMIQTNYFDQATPDIQQNTDRNVDIVFNVQEKESGTGQVSAGAGYSQRDGLVFTAGLTMPNFALTRPFVEGAGQAVNLTAEYGKYSKKIDIGITEPWFMDTPTLLGFRGYYWWRDYSQYSTTSEDVEERRKGLELRTGRRLKWPDIYFNFYANYNLSYREYLYGNALSYDVDTVVQGINIKSNG
ncbi:MAG: outer membrane protein assembly factor BamA, partial [Fibrobacteres bacterium]|nr:outer membrane protein assembly factor BamA [Fibrobacterota bacterium]